MKPASKKILLLRDSINIRYNHFITLMFMKDKTIPYIAMFHDITDKETDDPFSVRVAQFSDFLSNNQKSNIEFLHANDFLNTSYDLLRRKSLITFDDGYKSTYDIAWRILETKGIPFTVFITTSYLGKKGYMDICELKEMSKSPLCTIGMHSNLHRMWRFEDESDLIKDIIS